MSKERHTKSKIRYLALIIPYSLIVHDLITSMILLFVGLSFIFIGGFLSFYVGDLSTLFSSKPYYTSWTYSYIIIDKNSLKLLFNIEIIFLFIGIVIFLGSFIQLTKSKKKNLVIMDGGFYKYTRHPQYFGLGLFSLPMALYFPIINESYVIFASILAWVQSILLLFLFALLEERKMLKQYPVEYLNYIEKTPCIVPFFKIPDMGLWKRVSSGKRIYILILIIYFVSNLFLYILWYTKFFNTAPLGSF